MLFCKLTSPVTVNVCQVRNLYISETTIPITPNAPKLLLTTRFLKGNHTPKTNKMTDTIPIGLSRFIKPVISCTPFNPPYWLNNIGNKLIRNAIDRIIFFFIHSHSFAKSRFHTFFHFIYLHLKYSVTNFIGDRHLCRKGKLPLSEISDFAIFPELRFLKTVNGTAGRTIQADGIACIEVRSYLC